MYEEYLEKQKQLTNDMQNGKGGNFRLLIHEPATEPGALYNCIIYKTDKAKRWQSYFSRNNIVPYRRKCCYFLR